MNTKTTLTACGLLLSGIGLYFAPSRVISETRAAVQDLMRPGLEMVRLAKSRFGSQVDHVGQMDQTSPRNNDGQAIDQQLRELLEELEAERELNRSLQIRIARLCEQHSAEIEISNTVSKSERLVVPSLVEVGVLGDTIGEEWRTGKLLDQGSQKGMRENELVISPKNPHKSLIDVGEDTGLSIDDAILLGRCVIGKVANVGKWTSTFMLVTDAKYRGRAQIIRETENGFVYEARGVLKGQGTGLCRLDDIPAENSVQVGDTVYTAERSGILPTPLYYGKVVEVSLGRDDREWTIYVQPAPLPSQLTLVQVLRTAINHERLAVKQ